MPRMVAISASLMTGLRDHAARAFPEECCGILIGSRDANGIVVLRVVEGINVSSADRRQTYQVDWETLFQTVRSVRNAADGIVGFYHSHPDGSDRPSARDRELAWADYSYLILAMMGGRCTSITSWRLAESSGDFSQELLT